MVTFLQAALEKLRPNLLCNQVRTFGISFLVMLLWHSGAQAQTTYTWNLTGGGIWSTPTNWSPTRSTPAANDVLVFNTTGNATVTGVPTQTIGRLRHTGTGTITLQPAAGNITLTIQAGGISPQLDMTGGSFTINGLASGNQLTLAVSSSNTVETAGGSGGTRLTVSSFSTYLNNGNTITQNGASWVFDNNSVYQHGTNQGTIPLSTWAASSICLVTGATSGNGSGSANIANINQAFGIFRWNCAQTAHLNLAVNGSFSPALIEILRTTGTLAGAQFNANGARSLLSLVNSVAGGNVTLNLNNITVSASGGDALFAFSDAPASGGNTITVNLAGTVTLGGANQSRFIMVGNSAPTTINATGTTTWAVNGNGTLVYLDPGAKSNCNVTVNQAAGITVANSANAIVWPYRGFAAGGSPGGTNNTLTVTLGSFTQAASVTLQGNNSSFQAMAQNNGSATNQSDNSVNITVFGNFSAPSGVALTGLNYTDRSDAIRHVVTMNVRKSNAGNDGNIDINGTFTLGTGGNTLASNGNRAFLNVEGNILRGTYNGGNARTNVVGRIRMSGNGGQVGVTSAPSFGNAIDFEVDPGTGNSVSLANNLTLSSIGYLYLTSGTLNLNSRSLFVPANHWVNMAGGAISATPTYTAPHNLYYRTGTLTTGNEIGSAEADRIVIGDGVTLTAERDLRFRGVFCNKGTFTQSTSFTTINTGRGGMPLITDSADASNSTTFGQFTVNNQQNGSVTVWDLNATVAGNFTAQATGGDVAFRFITGPTAAIRTLTINGNYSIQTGARVDMSVGTGTLTTNGPNHSLVVAGNYTYNSGDAANRYVYTNSNFIQSINISVAGDFSSSVTSTGNQNFRNLSFTKSGTVSIANLNAEHYGNFTNTASTSVVVSGGRTIWRGGLQSIPQTIGTAGGASLALFNVTLDVANTSVSLLQDISINGTANATNNAGNAAFGSWFSTAIFDIATFKLTFSPSASNTVMFMPATACLDALDGEVIFNVASGNTTTVMRSTSFGRLTVNNTGGTVAGDAGVANINLTGITVINGTVNFINGSVTTTFAATGAQSISGTGTMTNRVILIASSANVSSTIAAMQYNVSFTNNGTFTATAGQVRTYGGTQIVDARSGVNTTFFDLLFTGNTGTPQLWDMDCVVNGTLTLQSDGSGFITQFPIIGTPRTYTINNLHFGTGNNGWGFNQSTGGRTLAQNITHTMVIRGNVTNALWINPFVFQLRYNNSGFNSVVNLTADPTGSDKTWDFTNTAASNVTMNLFRMAPAAAYSLSANISMHIFSGLENTSSQNMTMTAGRILFFGTTSITQSGSGSLTVFNVSLFGTNVTTLSGHIRFAGNGTGTSNEQGAIDVQAAATLVIGTSTLELVSAGGHITLNGSADFSNSSLIFRNTANPTINTAANRTFNNVTLDFQGATVLNLERNNRVYTFNGIVDAKNFQFVAGPGGNTAFFTFPNGSEFRTTNLNGFSGSTSTSISATNTAINTLDATNKVVYYAPSGTQTVTARTYSNLEITGGGTKTLAGNIVQAGGNTLLVDAGATLNTGIFTITRTGGSGNLVANINGTLQTGIAAGFNAASGTLPVTNVTINLGVNSVVEYTGSVSQTVTSVPSGTGAYQNLTLSNNTGLTLGTSTTVAGTLTLNGGSISLGNNSLTLGTSASAPGSLVVNSGLLATNGTGVFERWIPTTSLPTAVSSGIRFPVGTSSSDRSLYLAFSSATALSAGGTVAVRHNLANGVVAVGAPFLDGVGGNQITINENTNASWIITSPTAITLAGGESIKMQGIGTNIAAVPTVSEARMVTIPGPAPGTSVNGTGTVTSPIVGREDLAVADLTQTWYMGAADAQGVVVAVNATPANWGTATTWSSGTVPVATDYVVVPATAATVSVAGAASYPFLTLQVDQGATLAALAATLEPAAGGSINFFGTVTTTNPNGFSGAANTTVSNANSPAVSFGTTGTCEYNRTGSQTITPGQYHNLIISQNRGSGTITFSGLIQLTGALSYTASNVTNVLTGNTIEFNGTGTQTIPALTFYNNLSSAGTGARVISGVVGLSGDFTPGTNSYTVTGSTINFNGTGAQTIPAFQYDNLTSSSTGARTLASSGTIGILGVFTPGTNAYTTTGSTVAFNATLGQSVPVFNYHNLSVTGGRGSNTVTMASGIIGVAGALSIANNTLYSFTGNTISYNGTGSTSQTVTGGSHFTYNNLTISTSLTGGAQVILDPSNTIRIGGVFNPTATPGGAGYLNTNSRIFYTVGNTQVIAPFVYFTLETNNNNQNYALPTSGTIEIQNNWVGPTGNLNTLTGTGGTVRFSGSGNQTFPNVTNFWNLELTGTGIKTVQGNVTVRNNFTLNNTYMGIGAGVRVQIGESATQTGSLTVVGNAGVLNTQGNNSGSMSVRRYFGTSGLPTSFDNAGLFPFVRSYNNVISSRYIWLSFTSATALSTGGFLDVSFANGSGVAQDGLVAFTAFSDATGSPTLNISRAAGYKWIFTNGGLALNGGETINLRGENDGSMTVSNVGNTRLIYFNTGTSAHLVAPGVSPAGTGTQTKPQGNKTGLTIADLTAAQRAWAVATDRVVVQSLASGNYSNASIWAGGTVPTSGDDIEIVSPHSVALSTNSSANSVIIRNGATLQTNSFSMTLGSAQAMTVQGTLRIANPTLNADLASALSTANSPVLTLDPNSTVIYESNTAQTIANRTYQNLVFNGTSNLTINGTVTIEGSFSNTGTNSFTNSGTIDFNSTGALTVPNITYHNLTVRGARNANNVTFPSTVTLTGTFNPASTFTSGIWVISGSTFNYTGSAAQSVAPFNYNNLTISGSRGANVVTLSGNINIAGTFSPTATFTTGGRYDASASTITFDNTTAQTVPTFSYGNLTLAGARGANNLTLSGTVGVSGVFTPSASFTSGNYVTSGSTVDYNSTAAQVITPWDFYHNLTIQGSRGANNVTLIAGTIRVANNMVNSTSFTTGQIVANTNSTVEFTNAVSVQMPMNMTFFNLTMVNNPAVVWRLGTTRIGGTFGAGSGNYTNNDPNTVLFNGADGQVIPAKRYYHLSSTNNSRVLAAGTLTLEGDLSAGSGNYTAANTTLNLSGAAQAISAVSGPFAGITFAGYNTKTLSGAVSVIGGGAVTVTGTTVANGSNVTLGDLGTLTINTGGSISALTLANRANYVYNTAYTTGSELPTSSTAISNLTINPGSGNAVVLGNNVTVNGGLTLSSGRLDASSRNLTMTGTVSGSAPISGNTSTVLTVSGTSGGALGTLNFGPAVGDRQVGTLSILRSGGAGSLTLGTDLTVGTSISFDPAATTTINTGANTLRLGSSGTVTGEANGRYVVGNLYTERTQNNGNNNYGGMGVIINGCTNCNMGLVQVLRKTGNGTSITGANGNRSIDRTWDIEPQTQPASAVVLGLSWLSADDFYSSPGTQSRVWRSTDNGTTWSRMGSAGTFSNRSIWVVTDHFSDWTVADENNPLPLDFLSINAKRKGTGVEVSWTTINEVNTDRFDVERSTDGVAFMKVGSVAASRNTSEAVKYHHQDAQAPQGITLYYRVKQYDQDGKYDYSPVVALSADQNGQPSLNPNPAAGTVWLNMPASTLGDYTVTLTDAVGKVVRSQTLSQLTGASVNTIALDGIPAGVYQVTVTQAVTGSAWNSRLTIK